MKVYLAGPITGCSYKGAVTWREAASLTLSRHNITAFSPMRNKEYLSQEKEIAVSYSLPEHYMSQPKHLFNRDKNDVMTSDALLVNLYGAERVSIGTMFEIAWAHILDIPSIVVMELDNIHVHPFVTEAASFVVPTLEMGCEVVIKLLTNGVNPWVVSDPGGNLAAANPVLSKSVLRRLEHQLPPGRVEEVPVLQTDSSKSETSNPSVEGTTSRSLEEKTRQFAKFYGANFPGEEMA